MIILINWWWGDSPSLSRKIHILSCFSLFSILFSRKFEPKDSPKNDEVHYDAEIQHLTTISFNRMTVVLIDLYNMHAWFKDQLDRAPLLYCVFFRPGNCDRKIHLSKVKTSSKKREGFLIKWIWFTDQLDRAPLLHCVFRRPGNCDRKIHLSKVKTSSKKREGFKNFW